MIVFFPNLEQQVNHSGTPSMLFRSPVSLWMIFTVTLESQISKNATVATEVTSKTYMSSLTYNVTDGVLKEMLNLTFVIDYEGPGMSCR